MNTIKFKKINKSYDKKTKIIDDFNLEIKEGEFIVFIGPSGCGKSTLLRMIAGLESVSSGNIILDNEDITLMPPGKREIAMVFQSYALYPHMSVENNIGFSLKMDGIAKSKRKKRIKETAEILQLEKYLNRKPAELSGGQRQRVAIGRAIVRNSKLFLFDEPLSNLDAKLRVEMRLQITNLHKSLKSTMIYVTHDQVEAMTMADRIVVLKDGKIEQVGSPLELYEKPKNIFVASFLGAPKMNFINVILKNSSEENIDISLPCGKNLNFKHIEKTNISSTKTLIFGIRAEDIRIVQNNEDFKIKIDALEHLGSSTLIYGTYESQAIVINVKGTFLQKGKDIIGLKIKEEKAHLFTKEGIALKKKTISCK